MTRYAVAALSDVASALDQLRAPAELGDDAEARTVAGADRLLDALIALHHAVERLAAPAR